MAATNTPVSGANSILSFGWETTFKTVTSSFDKVFGFGQKLSTYDIDNDPEFVYGLGSQDMQRQFAKKFNGSWGVEAIYTDSYIWRAVLGGAPTDAGAGPYTHTWSSTAHIPNTMTPMSINVSNDLDTDSDHNLLGSVLQSFNMSAGVGEPVKVKLDGFYSALQKDTTVVKSSVVAPLNEPMYFQQASLQFPSATTILNVQNFELNFNRNVEAIWGLGSRLPVRHVAKQREYTMKVTVTYHNDTDFLDVVLGNSGGITDSVGVYNSTPAEVASLVFTLDNGGSTTASRKLVVTMANCFVTKASLPIQLEEVTKIDLDIRARSITSVVGTDNTAVTL